MRLQNAFRKEVFRKAPMSASMVKDPFTKAQYALSRIIRHCLVNVG